MVSQIEMKPEQKSEAALKATDEKKVVAGGDVTAESKSKEEDLKVIDEKKTKGKDLDIEAGKVAGALYPSMKEDPKARWRFIRKVYLILALQFIIAAGIAATFNRLRPLHRFLAGNSKAGAAFYAVTLVLPFIALVPMMIFRKRHPLNMVFLVVFTLCVSMPLGWISAFLNGMFLLEAAFVTTAVLVSLTLFTFWAARRGQDFHHLGPFLFSSLIVFLIYLVFKICFPVVDITLSIYGCLASMVYSGFIIYDTDKLIKRHNYDDYTVAAVSLYLDVVNLFLSLIFIPTFRV